MNHFSYRKFALFLVSTVFLLLVITPAQAYYFGDWSIDGYFKSQFGVFTEKKPFNKAEFGGSDDNIATAKQMMRWNINGQISDSIGLRAEVLGVWEPDYPNEKGVVYTNKQGVTVPMRANYYNSFDWRELTIEWKPSYSHSFKFGRQIINWGEAVSGRVIDQCNPDDSRSSSGFVGLDERYMPLWMLRGFHEIYSLKSSIEWLVAPIWQANRFEHSRGSVSQTPQGDGRTTSTNIPGQRFSARRENRPSKIFGADYVISFAGSASSILGAPYSSFYHGSDLITPGWEPGDGVEPLTRAEILAGGAGGALNAPVISDNTKFIILKEIPSFYPTDYTDHNVKNSRFGIKTKTLVADWELGLAWFQGPSHSPTTVYRDYNPLGYSIYPYLLANTVYMQYVYPRYNTYGIYGNYQFPWAIFMFESAYMPDREYSKFLMGIGRGGVAHQQRLDQTKQVDSITTLIGFSREQNIEWLNKYNVFSCRLQYTNNWYLDDMDDVAAIPPFYMKNEQMEHNILLSVSTSYSYRKYSPSLTLSYYPKGALYSSLGFNWIPDGFNGRLSISASYTNYWTTNDFTTGVSLYDNHDMATVGFTYSFY